MTDLKLLEYLESFLTPRRLGLYSKVLNKRTNHFTVAVEDVYQLHNTSAVIRSCDVFGIQNIHVIEEINVKRIDREIAMGAQKWVDINRYPTTKECLKTLKDKGYQVVATTPHDDSVVLSEFDITKPSVFFFGRELQGLSDAVLEAADVKLHIPMVGFTESLNISVSAAIVLQHVTSLLRKSEINWQLSDAEKLQKRMEWTKKIIKSHEQIIARYHEENS
ncbi:TrmH family RNA methyltransferase [Aquimarina sp. AD10]|uniref:tRNA (guanosine(18)-2'-O)-methyltransferase n=1 Tax=Aquimarina aggregata TaxID=1642818 RepID=A0A162DJW5_9FLAO|nr:MULTISPECIES: RNA methyltransferase [Aquimarina]AXT59038.1 TrmH family RNA methyltransferase [Aquimarina sp. AD10]KZS41528.1 rRNA methyltransferase [Aquimarina aggregata]RKM93371.1 TrmH family RNA methyltransferase [Aquimarina sp. AD10]